MSHSSQELWAVCYEVIFMNVKKWNRILSYVLVALVSITVTASVMLGIGVMDRKEQSKLDALEELILKCFIGEADQTLMGDAAANAMVNALGDRWSYYIPADQMQSYNEQKENAYVGIGVTITVREDGVGLDIVQVAEGGSAKEAGVRVGDVIVGVDGASIKDMSVDDVKNRIRGEANTQVELTILRDGKEQTLAVTRKQIKTPVATGKMLANKVGYIQIVNFNENCTSETIAAAKKLMEDGAEKLLVDVRFNPGGYVKELVAILDYLLPEGPIFISEDYAGKRTEELSDPECIDLPMAVLVNAESYSAAEFFAAALSEYGVATVIGEQTFGKGYFQNTYILPDGSAVGLSIGKYFTPKGISLAEKGITPDVVVPVDEETAAAIYAGLLNPDQDPQIQAALKALKEK